MRVAQTLFTLAALVSMAPLEGFAQSSGPATTPPQSAVRQGRIVSLGLTGTGALTGVPRETSLGVTRAAGNAVPDSYEVRSGDTLWDICGFFYDNPYAWPRVWSYNTQITNPHWIFPGDRVALRREQPAVPPTLVPEKQAGTPRVTGRRRAIVPETIYLRDIAFVDRQEEQASGEIVGSPEDRMILSTYDDAYIQFRSGSAVQPSTEYTVYVVEGAVQHPTTDQPLGHIVRFLGTVRITSYDPARRMARGTIVESIDTIERGNLVGLIGRRFNVVPPARNARNITATVVATIVPQRVIGEHHIVFIDAGGLDGVEPGNRLHVVRRGDPWRQSRDEDDPNAARYPNEVVAELRAIAVRRHTTTCLMIRSTTEIQVGDRVEMYRETP